MSGGCRKDGGVDVGRVTFASYWLMLPSSCPAIM